MITRLTIALVLITAILSCSSSDNSKTTTDMSSILVENIAGFTRKSRVKVFPPDSLYNYINRTADDYIPYGVVRVAIGEYSKGDLIYSVDLFEFSNPLGAFGIYSKRRLPDDEFIGLGTEALLGAGFIYYLKDRFYITINSYSDNLPDFESLINFASALDSLIPGAAAYPYQVRAFPQKRLVKHSDKFWPHGLDNFAAPESCFSALYKKNNAICTLFFSVNRTRTEYDTIVKVIQKRALILSHTAGLGQNSIYAVSDQDGKMLVGYSEGVIFGVIGISGDYWAKALIRALLENLEIEL